MKTTIAVFWGFLLMTALPVLAQQSTYRTESIVRVDSQDTLSNNVMLTGQTVEIMGHLNNDLFSASRHFVLNGRVNDDAIVAGQMVSVYGPILVIC